MTLFQAQLDSNDVDRIRPFSNGSLKSAGPALERERKKNTENSTAPQFQLEVKTVTRNDWSSLSLPIHLPSKKKKKCQSLAICTVHLSFHGGQFDRFEKRARMYAQRCRSVWTVCWLCGCDRSIIPSEIVDREKPLELMYFSENRKNIELQKKKNELKCNFDKTVTL